MKIRIAVGFVVLVVALLLVPAGDASALGLKVAPLQYKATLKENEAQRGFIDISNPSTQAVSIQTSVQAFRQINDDGGLQFYDSAAVSAGIQPELSTFELAGRQAIRMFFTIDGKALPEGDVYAAVFFTTEPKQPKNGVGQVVRVGTLLSIVNKTPGLRKAEVTTMSVPILQLSPTVKGTYNIKNTGPEGTGFYPTVRVSSWPGGEPRDIEGSLVFGGRERKNVFSYETGLGVHLVEVSYGNSKRSQWVIAVEPWMLVAFLLVALIIGIELLLLKKRRKLAKKNASKKHPPTPEK